MCGVPAVTSAACLQDQVHGCPYKVFSKGQLAAALGKLGLKSQASQAVAQKAQEGHFQLACAAAFEGMHGCACDTGINHPNQVGWQASTVLTQELRTQLSH